MKRKIMLNLEDIRNNLRVYIVGEKDLYMKQNNYDDPKHFCEEELGIPFDPEYYSEDFPHYIVNLDGEHYNIYYCRDGFTAYDPDLQEDGCYKEFTREQVLEFFNKKDIEKIEHN